MPPTRTKLEKSSQPYPAPHPKFRNKVTFNPTPSPLPCPFLNVPKQETPTPSPPFTIKISKDTHGNHVCAINPENKNTKFKCDDKSKPCYYQENSTKRTSECQETESQHQIFKKPKAKKETSTPSLSFKTTHLPNSFKNLVTLPFKPLSPPVTEAWLNIGKQEPSSKIISALPEWATRTCRTVPATRPGTPSPASTASPTTPGRTSPPQPASSPQTASSAKSEFTAPAKKVRISHVSNTFYIIAILLLPTHTATFSLWPFKSSETKLCDITLDLQNTDETKTEIVNVTENILNIRISPIENPQGHFQDKIIQFQTIESLDKIDDLKKACTEGGGETFSPLSAEQIADILSFAKENTIVLDLKKGGTKYFIGPHQIEAPASGHTVPSDSEYIAFTQMDLIDVLYLSKTSQLDQSRKFFLTCLHKNKNNKNTALLTSAQLDLFSYSNILLDLISSLVNHYNEFTEEEECIPITFQAYKNSTFPTIPSYLTSGNMNTVLSAIKDSKKELKKLFERANELIKEKFEVTKKATSFLDLIYNFNLTILSNVLIFLLINTIFVLLCCLCCCLGACSYSRNRTAGSILTGA